MNRGFAALGGKLFKVDLEGTLLAMDAKSGAVLWETQMEDYKKGYSATAAPIIVKNLVVTGMAGAEYGTRGFIDAYDPETGKRVWRFYTVAGEGNRAAKPGTARPGNAAEGRRGYRIYDPKLNLIYWGTGNPGPDLNGEVRPGDNLYTCSLVAIDADTGKLKWHFQFTPHDVHDWDAVGDPILTDIDVSGNRCRP